MLHDCLDVLSTTFNSDLKKEQDDPRGYNGYARHRERVHVSACKNKFVCLPGNSTSCSWTFLFIFFGVFYCSVQIIPSVTLNIGTEKVFSVKIKHAPMAGNSQVNILSLRFLSHPSHDLSPQLCESGWEGPEHDRSIRLLWQGWGWHLNPQRPGREEDDERKKKSKELGVNGLWEWG